MSKRVSVLSYTDFPSDARPRREARALASRGDDVTVYALGLRGHYELDGCKVHELPVERYRGSGIASYLASYSRFMLRAARRLALNPTPDVVHVHTLPDFMVFAAFVPKLRGARIVLDVHDPMPELYASKSGLGPHHPIIRAVSAQQHASLKFADHIICTHALFRERLIGLGVEPRQISVTLNVADDALFGQPGAASQRCAAPPRLVYHGTIAERLGLDLAVRAFARLRKKHHRLRFQILGRGDFAPKLRALIEQLQLTAAIDFPEEQLPVDQLARTIGDATLGVIANRNDPATRLMLPVKLLEYLHMGIPTVAPRLPAITQYFDESQVGLYQPENITELATRVDELLSHAEKRAQLRARGLEFACTMNQQRVARELYRAIDGEV